jgi:HAMP domain-containing protein
MSMQILLMVLVTLMLVAGGVLALALARRLAGKVRRS